MSSSNVLVLAALVCVASLAGARSSARGGCDQWQPVAEGFNSPPLAFTEFNGDLIAGGHFTQSGTTSTGRVARFNGMGWEAVGFGLNAEVRALAVYDGYLIAAGSFTEVNGNPVGRIVRLINGQWEPLTPTDLGLNHTVHALAVFNNDLYAGGDFTQAGGSPANYIARFDGNQWHALGDHAPGGGMGADSYVRALTVYQDQLVAGGHFLFAGNIWSRGLARWNGTNWQPFVPVEGTTSHAGTNGAVYALAVDGDRLYVGGGFGGAGTVSAENVACWNGSTFIALGANSTFPGGGVNDLVQSLALVPQGSGQADLVACGWFTQAAGELATFVVRWHPTTNAWSPIGGGVGSVSYALIHMDDGMNGSLIIGGAFLQVDGQTSALRVARWDDCPGTCAGDITADQQVNVNDLLSVINAWGACPNPNDCSADVAPPGGDGVVNVNDLLLVINHWGACP